MTTQTERDQAVATLAPLISGVRSCLFTTMTTDGRHVTRPMAVQTVEFDGELWFFVDDESDKVAQIKEHPQVNLGFADEKDSSWVSISGPARLVQDRAKAEELWSPALEVWFADGLDTPSLALIAVTAETAEYWNASSSKVKQVIGGLRAAVTGDPDKFPSTNETLELR